jgi:hypothetical protein
MERFPIFVRLAIQSLFAESPSVVRDRDETTQARKRDVRLSAIRLVEDYLVSRVAARAGLQLVWQRRAPFCLFLRSFSMGHHLRQTSEAEWLDTRERVGGRLLELVSGVLEERAALVAIASPDEWLPNRLVRGPFANLVVDDEAWRQVVIPLIEAAQMIVVHRAEPSSGVDYELDGIRAAERESATIVVREPQLTGDGAAFLPDPALARCRVLEWRDDDVLSSELSEAVARLLHAGGQRWTEPMPSIEPAWAPPEEAAQYRLDAQRAYQAARRCGDAGQIRMAEELLFECFGAGCAADDVGSRALACLELARLFLLRGDDARAAVTPAEYASGHFGTLGRREYAFQALHVYAAAQRACGNSGAARALLEQAEEWEPTADEHEWQRAFWNAIKTQGT